MGLFLFLAQKQQQQQGQRQPKGSYRNSKWRQGDDEMLKADNNFIYTRINNTEMYCANIFKYVK